MKTLLGLSAATAIGLAGTAAWAQSDSKGESSPAKPQFAEVVAEHFDAWDTNDDGTLTATEIDKACVDAKVKGREAAAVAALKRIVRSDKYELPALTKPYLTMKAARPAVENAPKDADRADSTEADTTPAPDRDRAPAPRARPTSGSSTAKITTRPNFQRGFESSLTRIEKTDRALFGADGEPTIDHCHQGPLGDCFFVSVVGGMVKRDSTSLKQMIRERAADEGGGYTITLGAGREVKITPLTDAEIAISSTTSDKGGDEGLWLAVLEKAYGTSRIENAPPERYTMESATDAIAKGGSTATVIRDLTGHTTERITLKTRFRMPWYEQYNDNKQLVPLPAGARLIMQPAQAPSKLADAVREKVPVALKAGRLVATGTGEEKQPPGISGKHAYAVLAYDQDRDVLTLWNPHGNTYAPRGGKEPGLAGGYPTKAGIFEMPVADFVRVFNGVTIETDRKASTSGRRGRA